MLNWNDFQKKEIKLEKKKPGRCLPNASKIESRWIHASGSWANIAPAAANSIGNLEHLATHLKENDILQIKWP